VLQKAGRKKKGRAILAERVPGSDPTGFVKQLNLSETVSFCSSLHLSLADQVQRFIPLQGSARCLERTEAHPRLGQSFDEPMVWFDERGEVFHLPPFHVFRQESSRFELSHGLGRGRVLVDSDHSRCLLRRCACLGQTGLRRRLIDLTGLGC
jgi:hypothetical protein